MTTDTIFLLAPGFLDDGRREYCPECAEIWGLFAYFPAIKEGLDICYQEIARPRRELVELLGDSNQNCPTLILDEASPVFDNCGIKIHNGHRFIDNARDIGVYYAHRYGTPLPRGS